MKPFFDTIDLLNIEVEDLTKNNILEKIKKNITETKEFCHIVSLNPEIMVMQTQQQQYHDVLRQAAIRIVDGVGVAIALKLKGARRIERYSGVDLMEDLAAYANEMGLRILLIGGRGDLAEKLADCYNERFAKLTFKGISGSKDIKNITDVENSSIFSIVADFRPHIIFVSFGSPWQELWIDRNQDQLAGIVCMGVGGAFDFISGNVRRAPKFIRSLGMEWLFRLIIQPWRWRRQLRLLLFVWLVFKEIVFSKKNKL